MAIRDHQQVLPANEEVPIELLDLPATGHADTHHRLPTHVAGEHMQQLALEFHARVLDVELWVVANVATGELGERRYGGQVDVLLRSPEHLHGDLCSRQLCGELLVAVAHWTQQFHLTVGAQESWVVPRRLQGELANAGDASAEDQELAADVLHGHEGPLDGGTQAGLVDLGVAEMRGEGVQQRHDGILALLDGHQDVVR
mmetsp:Transcript_19615/g.61521  ORF Transcript_19615/g.61521 Transcript_19615/m.61521 type:complete len:200 (-) Transcript_19615:831-1430(-)